jgi:signal transduction histidine kinase
MKPELLHFDVSTGLKRVLGSELITNDEVAVFELVKNSFDADARHVDVFFADDKIVISDNGTGMSLEDIKTKWLFVGYSAKRNTRKSDDFRDEIAGRTHYAGSKGVGRISSDRLGQVVTLQTRAKKEKSGPVHRIVVDWALFDKNHKQHFESVKLPHTEQTKGFDLPRGVRKLSQGTVISIEKVRQTWDREKILRLKSSLAKLINPFGTSADGFTIKIHAPSEAAADKNELRKAKRSDTEPRPNSIVNGEVGNFIFSTLQEKTTFINVTVDSTGRFLESSLTDRGELIYRIREPNEYRALAKSGFKCQIFFLNQSAKSTFARRMGVPSVQFGSVFLFRNEFRVFPVGDEGDDWFRMDRRKQQGYARFLGTRDVIGRIDVSGSDADFTEASSRNEGLLETEAVLELRDCFMENCLKRLERYVVPVTFADREDKNTSDVSRLLTDPGKARVASAVAKLVNSGKIELLEYSQRLIGVLDERSEQFESSLLSLRAIAEKTKDRDLFKKIETAEKRFEELRRSEEAARQQADKEREAKEAAEERAAQAEGHYEEEKKRNLFLTSIASLDTETILNLHHQVTIYAVRIQQEIENFLVAISRKKSVPTADVINAFEGIALNNRKVMGVSKFATKANFRLKSEKIRANLSDYIQQYITEVESDFLLGNLSATAESDGKGFLQEFKPIDVAVVIDNLIANAKKAGATKIGFAITHPTKDSIHIRVSDNGKGFSKKIGDLSRIFEKGFTTTDGSGLGLYHVRHVLGELKGTIEIDKKGEDRGAVFLIRISK